MCKNGANLAFHACLQQNGVTALTPENAERKLTKKKCHHLTALIVAPVNSE